MTEADLAALRAEEGARVVERQGRYWVETFRGFYQPIHQLARLSWTEVARPTLGCWGYRAVLAERDAGRANGMYPVHLLEDVTTFTESALEESRRRDLRRCRSQVEIIRARDAEPFLRAGWTVYQSAMERIGGPRYGSRRAYEQAIVMRCQDPRRLIIAGFIDGRLAGYLESYAVAGILYGRDLLVATEYAKSGIATGLYVETMRIGAQSGAVESLCLGPVIQDHPGLGWFTKTLGVPAVEVPTRVEIPRPIREFMRWRRPAVYFRITGGSSGPGGARRPAGTG